MCVARKRDVQGLPPVLHVRGGTVERLEQIMGEIAHYAPPDLCHDWERRIRAILWQQGEQFIAPMMRRP